MSHSASECANLPNNVRKKRPGNSKQQKKEHLQKNNSNVGTKTHVKSKTKLEILLKKIDKELQSRVK